MAYVSSGMVFSASTTATLAVSGGISPLTGESVRSRRRLMVWCTWYKEIAAGRIYCVYDISRECVKKSPPVSFPWDSGSETALVMELQMGTLVGTQCPASTLKRCHPHSPKVVETITSAQRANSNDDLRLKSDYSKM